MIGISAVIISKNEEKHIGRCLESLMDVADEIIVVDSYSDDQTESICKSFGKVIFSQHSFDTYSAQKNRANELASGAYILSMDADEYLSDELVAEIREIKENPGHIAYRFPRLNHIGKKALRHGLWFPDRKIRLFAKGEAKWVGNGVHETLDVANNDIKDNASYLMHTAFENTSEIADKFEKYSTLWAEERFRLKKSVGFMSWYGHAFWTAFRGIVLKHAFMDGVVGIKLLKAQVNESYKKYIKLHRLNKYGRF